MYRLYSKNKKQKGIALRHIHEKNRSLCSSDYPRYNLIKDLVHHILGGCDIHYSLRCHDEFFEQVFMFIRAVAHWEANLHGVELVPSLDLCRGQRHRRTMTNAVKGDLLNVGRNVMEASINEGTPSVDGVRGCVRRQLERLQLHCQG